MEDAGIAALTARFDPEQDAAHGFPVWPDNAAAVDAFCACATQWRVTGAGLGGMTFIGLDYQSCATLLEARQMPLTPDGWQRLQIIEAAAMAGLNAPDGGADRP